MGVAMNANTKDVSAGLLFIAIAALFALGTQELELGTARKLGPCSCRPWYPYKVPFR